MASQRLFIYELPEKLKALVHDSRIGSWKRLAEFTGIPIATLKQVRDDDDVVAYSRLGKTHRDRLAEKFGFPPDMPEWIAPARLTGDTGPGPDTAEAFAAKYRSDYAAATSVASKAVDPISSVDEKTTNAVRDVAAVLTAGNRRPGFSPLGTMAQLALDLGQSAGPGAHQILVEVSCHKGNIIGSSRRFAVRRALLSIDCGDARGRRAALPGINGLPVVLKNSCGETRFVWSGIERLLRWEVAAGGATIGYLWFDAGVVEGLAPGDLLRVSLSAWLKHIDTDEFDEDPAFGIIDSAGELAQLPQETFTVEQRRLVEHINKLTLNSDDNGQAEIAAAELELVRKP